MRRLAVMMACGLLTMGATACGKTTRNSNELEPGDASTTGDSTSGGTSSPPEEPNDRDSPPDDCSPAEDLFVEALGTHTLAADYGATVVDGLGGTDLEVTVTPIPSEACTDETEMPVVVRLVTGDQVIDASSAPTVLAYDDDGGDVLLRIELSATRSWSQVAFSPSSEASPALGAPTLEWIEKQSAELSAVFMPPGEHYGAEYSGSFDVLSWPADCWDEPDIWRESHARVETGLEEQYAALEHHLPLALNWLGGDGAELDLGVTPNGPVCSVRAEQPVIVAASSNDGRVDAVWHARATRADSTWLTLDAVVSDRGALEERLGIRLDSAGEYDAYGLRFSLRWRDDAPIGMLQVLGIDREQCGDDDDICAEAAEIAVATLGKLGAEVSSEVLSRDLTGASGVCPEPTLVVSGVGSPLLEGIIENDTSLNTDAIDQCNGGSPRLAIDWEAPHAGRFRFDTHQSNYDTVLTLRPLTSDGQCASLSGDACNDDSGEQLTSEITTTLSEGQVVRVEIASYGGLLQTADSSATYRLNITETA